MIKVMSRQFSQKLLLVLFVWGCMAVNVLAESYMRAFTWYPKYITSQWYAGANMRDNAVREVCDQLEVYYGFSFRIWNGGNSPASCVGGNYSIGLAFRYTNDNSCTSKGWTFDSSTGQCVDPNPPPEKKYTIKLSPVTAQAYGNYLTALEPDKVWRKIGGEQRLINTVKLTAEVKDQDGNRVNAAIKLKVTAKEGSGGHIQAYHTDRNPLQAGKLKVGSLNSHTINISKSSMVDGLVEFEFEASPISGAHKIEATCEDIVCEQIDKDSVWVGIQDLIVLPASSNYVFVGKTKHHEENHYATQRMIEKIQRIAIGYRELFPYDDTLHINDISLERGGLFDARGDKVPVVKANWNPPHNLHRTGEDVDIRANQNSGAIPHENFSEFAKLAATKGCVPKLEDGGTPNQHFHLFCTKAQGK